MGFRLPGAILGKQVLHRSASKVDSASLDVPKGLCAVYVGEAQKKRYVVPVSYLNRPSLLDLLNKAEEEFGFDHPTGCLTIPCDVETFIDVTCRLH